MTKQLTDYIKQPIGGYDAYLVYRQGEQPHALCATVTQCQAQGYIVLCLFREAMSTVRLFNS